MSNIIPISPRNTNGLRWQRLSGYAFASTDIFCPIILAEAPKAMLHYTLGFVTGSSGFEPVVLLGLQKDKNLYVRSEGGWTVPYVPARYRGYPFLLAPTSEGEYVLSFDKRVGSLTSDGSGHAFFEGSALSPELAEIYKFLTNVFNSQILTTKICAELDSHNLIEPWPIDLKVGDDQISIKGVYRVDEERLRTLGAEALSELHKSSAMNLIFCQLLSMQNFERLIQLHLRHKAASFNAANNPAEVLADGGTLNFDNI